MVLTNEICRVFEERLVKSNVFTKEEIKIIKKDYELFAKCYALGCADMFDYKSKKES